MKILLALVLLTGAAFGQGNLSTGSASLFIGASTAQRLTIATGTNAALLTGTGGTLYVNGVAVGTGGGGGTPAGSSGQVQYNNGGSFGGVPYLTVTGTGTATAITGTMSSLTLAGGTSVVITGSAGRVYVGSNIIPVMGTGLNIGDLNATGYMTAVSGLIVPGSGTDYTLFDHDSIYAIGTSGASVTLRLNVPNTGATARFVDVPNSGTLLPYFAYGTAATLSFGTGGVLSLGSTGYITAGTGATLGTITGTSGSLVASGLTLSSGTTAVVGNIGIGSTGSLSIRVGNGNYTIRPGSSTAWGLVYLNDGTATSALNYQGFRVRNDAGYTWPSGTTPEGSADTAISRSSAGIVMFGTDLGNASGGIRAATGTIGTLTVGTAGALTVTGTYGSVGTGTHSRGFVIGIGTDGSLQARGTSGTITTLAPP